MNRRSVVLGIAPFLLATGAKALGRPPPGPTPGWHFPPPPPPPDPPDYPDFASRDGGSGGSEGGSSGGGGQGGSGGGGSSGSSSSDVRLKQDIVF